MAHREALSAYTGAVVDELAKAGVKNVVVSPGSRSTPLAYMLMEHDEIQVHLNIDERSAGFFALGMAKALQEPVGLLCTSGTAAANYYPAVVEAKISRIPLVVMTADRPHELRDVGAPQAIDQIHLYGRHVKWFVEMALPEESDDMIRYARNVCARAAATALQAPAGPVHLNFPFREPLIPHMEDKRWFKGKSESKSIGILQGELTLPESFYQSCADKMMQAERGLIICGPMDSPSFNSKVLSLSKKTGFPVLADPLSQLRSDGSTSDAIIDTYDTFLRFEDVKKALKPDLILRFGAMPVSKPLTIYLKDQVDAELLVIDGGAGWREPAGIADDMLYCDETVFCREMMSLVDRKEDRTWLDEWKKINDLAKSGLGRIRDFSEMDEGKLFAVLADLMPHNSSLFVGNSMPVRDLDTFFLSPANHVRTFCNRGANGIDGVVSSALGVSAVLDQTVLVIGDISFFHDMNGLMAARLLKLDMTIIIVNNDGGGIFSFLPQSQEEKHFEELFGTPHGLEFKQAVSLYGGEYYAPQSWEEFSDRFSSSFAKKGLKVIELRTERSENVRRHRELWNEVSREISSSFIEGRK
ncbi:2-succinyl-5-enolpyruvyl-6-hydroxy-3-cyclohexene-1-carboxylic-acid synthase [Peribacillus kribbensis]|uniref:2-succinyl-5-enolpyruvyl-6-hydroxy-3- cyclohexene-1-carboxylic-acid synthase n=1 Tax=Peribacillus kribbensis TaxID=356658 RepID=UPI00041C6D76|nr:2-succinyl-5-enolpyruvyl-6-hydroxy-3-cyclohexene-1-carboxylic-acid synthase [Peribacillus kribbensis]